MNRLSTTLYSICEWIMRFSYVNMLWILFTFLGLFVFGIFPSFVASLTVMRKWILGQSDIPIFHTFWQSYKKEFIKSNAIGVVFLLIGYLFYIEVSLVIEHSTTLLQLSKYPLYLFGIIYIFVLLYIFPTYVHYDVKFVQTIKNSILIMIVNPIQNIMMILGIIALYYLFTIIPALFLFFGISVPAFIIMWSCYQSFQSVQRKKEKAFNA